MVQLPDSLTPAWVDPRVRRTRHLLHEALEKLLEETAFENISVGDIAEKATLNRATFYDHYPDKFALLEGLVSCRFLCLLQQRHVVFTGDCPKAIMAIALAMCDYMVGIPGIECRNRRPMEKHLEAALTAVVRDMLLRGMERFPPPNAVPPRMMAAALSGAMYSGVNEWLRTPDRCPAEEIVTTIFRLICPMLGVDPRVLEMYEPAVTA